MTRNISLRFEKPAWISAAEDRDGADPLLVADKERLPSGFV
jgi:hypothetical protein